MIRRIILILLLAMLLTACGGAAPTEEAPAATEEFIAAGVPVQEEQTPQPTIEELDTATPEPATETFTPEATETPAGTATETPLPTLELPTVAFNAPLLMAWDGVPTYLGDSTPGFAFRVSYDPELWAATTDQFGFAAIAHRNIPNCVVSVTVGRGLPPTLSVEHEILRTEDVTFDVATAYENGVKKFVTYTGGDGNIITAFEVSFIEESDACLADAVIVLSTLRSVPASQATPTLTP